MADNKRIRITADSTPLQDLRRSAEALWSNMSTMEEAFRGLSEKSVESIQKQIDLLKERNSLQGGFSLPDGIVTSGRGRSAIIDPNTGRYADGRTVPGTDFRVSPTAPNDRQMGIFEKIYSQIIRIADIIEKEGRDDINGALPDNSGGGGGVPVPTPPDHNQGGGGDNNNNNRRGGGSGFQIPTSIPALMRMLGAGGIAAGIVGGLGMLVGRQFQWDAQQYAMGNRYEREANLGNHWLLNALTFGISGAEANKELVRVNAAKTIEEPGSQLARLQGSTYHNALRNAIGTSGAELRGSSNWRENIFTDSWGGTHINYINNNTGEISSNKPQELKDIEELGRYTAENSWYARSLGMNISEFTQRQNELAMAAGGMRAQINPYKLEQLMLAQQIRGISNSDIESLQRTVRFGSDQRYATGSAYSVISSFDRTLQLMGKTNSEIVGTLSEYLGQFNRTASGVLEKTGSVNTGQITRLVSSLMMRGFEGRQLERVTGALSGQQVSQDDTSQALLLRAARKLYPDKSLFELEAEIEQMANSGKIMPEVWDMLKEMSGGADTEMFRRTLDTFFPNLTKSDIMALTSPKLAKMSGEELINSGVLTSKGFSRERAAQITGSQEADSARTETEKIIAGAEFVQKEAGKDLSKPEEVAKNNEQPTDAGMLSLDYEKNQVDILSQILGILKQFDRGAFSLYIDGQ